eukprot:gb/GECH01001666.1/.p1 GENE.gb/GECH01001666.1/~~gb/GECH01001666.1/.p1  ORF type:complete len:445 (+),score=88.27 gb/GECH01001666.1/:1-1335(+)
MFVKPKPSYFPTTFRSCLKNSSYLTRNQGEPFNVFREYSSKAAKKSNFHPFVYKRLITTPQESKIKEIVDIVEPKDYVLCKTLHGKPDGRVIVKLPQKKRFKLKRLKKIDSPISQEESHVSDFEKERDMLAKELHIREPWIRIAPILRPISTQVIRSFFGRQYPIQEIAVPSFSCSTTDKTAYIKFESVEMAKQVLETRQGLRLGNRKVALYWARNCEVKTAVSGGSNYGLAIPSHTHPKKKIKQVELDGHASHHIVRILGVPETMSEQEFIDFFQSRVQIPILCFHRQSNIFDKPIPSVFVELSSEEHVQLTLKYIDQATKVTIDGKRRKIPPLDVVPYISPGEMISSLYRYLAFLPRWCSAYQSGKSIRMSNLPSDAKKKDIWRFFQDFEFDRQNIQFGYSKLGIHDGHAYVTFSSSQEAHKAFDAKQLNSINDCFVFLQLV